MNSEGRLVLYLFAIIATMNAVHFVSGQRMPLYITQSLYSRDYLLVYDVRYNKGDQHLTVLDSDGNNVLVACPRNADQDHTSLEIRDRVTQANLSLQCETPVTSRIFLPSPAFQYLPNVIGFLVFIPNTSAIRDYDIPPNHELVEFISFKFDESLRRIKMVSYRLGAGKLLKPEISVENNTKEYQKDKQFFPYDLDVLYSKTKLLVIKVQLAPEGDFFFDNWKSASRHNVITAPMWSDWLPQWQALETFIRKVAQITNSVNIRTGVYDTLTTQSRFIGSSQKIYLHGGKHPIPKYFWKFIYIKTRIGDFQNRIYGRLFVMPNVDPNTQKDVEKICPVEDDITETGWKFLSDDNKFKTSMYACIFNVATLKSFPEALLDFNSLYAYDFKPFDLREVPVVRFDDKGRRIDTVKVNVIEEMRLKEAKDDLGNDINAEQLSGGEIKSDHV